MKKSLLLAAAALTLASAAFAGPGKDKKPAKPAASKTEIKCAVLGNKVNIAEATKSKMFADYKGNRYFFCCGGCPTAFKKDPAKYAKADHIKAPKDKSTKKG